MIRFKRSDFKPNIGSGWVTFNVKAEDADEAERRLAVKGLTPLEQKLLDALEKAEEHLEYCGWGDKYERDCARDAKLPEQVAAAIAAAKEAR